MELASIYTRIWMNESRKEVEVILGDYHLSPLCSLTVLRPKQVKGDSSKSNTAS